MLSVSKGIGIIKICSGAKKLSHNEITHIKNLNIRCFILHFIKYTKPALYQLF